MARFCLATGQSPDVYRGLSLRERAAFIDAHIEMHGGE
jgi:hypothetical protein